MFMFFIYLNKIRRVRVTHGVGQVKKESHKKMNTGLQFIVLNIRIFEFEA